MTRPTAVPFVSLILAALAAALSFVPGGAERFELSRTLVAAEPWRILTGHFAHWSGDHAFWDIVAFLALAGVCELRNRRRLLAALGGSGLAISWAFLLFERDLDVYRGLSGMVSALFALLAVSILRERDDGANRWLRGFALLSLLGFAGKVGVEVAFDTTLFVSTADRFQVVPLAHLIGALVGGAAAWLEVPHRKPHPVAAGV